jgi:hypothetical protein
MQWAVLHGWWLAAELRLQGPEFAGFDFNANLDPFGFSSVRVYRALCPVE